LLYGEQFAPAIQVLQVLLIGVAARALTSPMLEMYYSSGAPRFAVIVLGLNLGVMTILIAILTPAYAALGAGIAFAAGNIFGLIVAYVIAGLRYDVKLRSCFLITVKDIRFIVSNLRAARRRTPS
jgi:O-antigen/teichoic acid export membrane protein